MTGDDQVAPHRFAAAVAASLDKVVPPGFTVTSLGPSVDVFSAGVSRHASAGAQTLAQPRNPVEEQIAGVAWAILNGAQDGVMEISTEPWPVDADGRVGEPGARVQGTTLRMRFGKENAPILVLPVVELADPPFRAEPHFVDRPVEYRVSLRRDRIGRLIARGMGVVALGFGAVSIFGGVSILKRVVAALFFVNFAFWIFHIARTTPGPAADPSEVESWDDS